MIYEDYGKTNMVFNGLSIIFLLISLYFATKFMFFGKSHFDLYSSILLSSIVYLTVWIDIQDSKNGDFDK
jgi:hypothetical protein